MTTTPVPAASAGRPLLPWLVWGTGLLAYVVAVMHRTSLGVAGVDAQERFGASASALASLAVVQLLVYAGLQVPVGVLLDRFGSRRLLVTGALVMAAGQAVLAVSTTTPPAVAGRLLVGVGDAMTFISLLRLVPAWFPTRWVPLPRLESTEVHRALADAGVVVGALIVNRRTPAQWGTAFATRRQQEAAEIAALIADVPGVPVVELEAMGSDVTGGSALRAVTDQILSS